MLSEIQMMNLCSLAHQDAEDVAGKVTAYDPDLSVVWGPAWKSDGIKDIPYSFAYVAKSASTGNYTVVIRGTTVESARAWISEDFSIHKTEPFTRFVSSAPVGALLSKGAADGLSDLLELSSGAGYAGKGTLLEFLLGLQDLKFIAVTGHSLGGTLTGPLFAKLYAALEAAEGGRPEMDLMSFAGLSPGDQGFATYLASVTPRTGWRVVNPLDVAPHFFSQRDQVLQIYDGENLKCPLPFEVLIRALFARAGTVYVQPGGSPKVLPKVFLKADTKWAEQLKNQHVHGTYVKLVEQQG